MEIYFFFKFLIFVLFDFILYHPHHGCMRKGIDFVMGTFAEEGAMDGVKQKVIGCL